MRDLEEVIKGLEVCVSREPGGDYICYKCPYEVDGNDCEINATNDAIALLKEQEPAKVRHLHGTKVTVHAEIVFEDACENCGSCLLKHWKACPICGKPVKWDG